MIHKKHYTFRLTDIFEERTMGDFSIRKEVLLKGTMVRTYWAGGYFYHDRLASDFPIVKLVEKGTVWMSDTPAEQESLRMPTMLARGDTLIIGLGLGFLPMYLSMRNQLVKTVTIIEQSQGVVDLVYNKVKSARTSVKVVDGKEFLATTESKYDFIYIDVWDCIVAPIEEINHWSSLAKRCLKPGGEVRCWLQELYDRVKSKLPKEPTAATSLPGQHDPCLICGNEFRNDYGGLCMDCADILQVSEMYVKK